MSLLEKEGLLNDDFDEGNTTSNYENQNGCVNKTDATGNEVKADPKRWYILILFACMGFTQGGVWNTWGPISQSSEFAFGWTDGVIALMSNWGPIAYIPLALPFSWLMDVKGLRSACLISAFCISVGCGLRCITSHIPAATWLIHTGQLFNGMGGPVAMAGPPLLSAVWFPVHQRTTATAISAGSAGLGIAASFTIGPLLVSGVYNKTVCLNTTLHLSQAYNESGCHEQKIHITKDIMFLMYIEFAFSALIFLLMLIYFPNGPKIMPSITAAIKRTDFVKGIKDLMRNGKFWMLTVPYALAAGVFGAWGSVMDVVLKPLGVSEITAGWMGFWGAIVGLIAAILIAMFADHFAKRMKILLIVLYSGAALVFIPFALECMGIIPVNEPSLYVMQILVNVFVSGTIPLFFELGCESSYPVAEGITNGVMTWLNNVCGMVFLLALMIPGIGTTWTNWCVIASFALPIPLFLFYKERYSRYDIDVITKTVAKPVETTG